MTIEERIMGHTLHKEVIAWDQGYQAALRYRGRSRQDYDAFAHTCPYPFDMALKREWFNGVALVYEEKRSAAAAYISRRKN